MRRALGFLVCCPMFVALSPASASDVYNSRPFRQIVTVPNILQHEQVLQNIANANGGTRVAGAAGQCTDGRLHRLDDDRRWLGRAEAAVRIPVLPGAGAVDV